MKKIEINGNAFSNISQFYDEIERKFTKGLSWKIGRNLDAFNDVLSGGFGVYDSGEAVEVVWINADKSKSDLGATETLQYLKKILARCHPSNKKSVENDMALVESGQGETLFDMIVATIKQYDNIKLLLS
jgi:RNAse (barnase) inhibitor barstar